MTVLIAHRGSHESAPENTLAAFAAAAGHGAEMVELDVRACAGGELVVVHDPEVAARPVGELSHRALCELSRTEVPTLAEVVAWAAGAGIGLDVELKEDGDLDRVLAVLAGFPGRLLITSFLDPVLARLAALAPGIERGLLFSRGARGAVARVRDCSAHAAVLAATRLNEDVVDVLHTAGLGTYVWDFMPGRGDRDAWLRDPRIRGVITDDIPETRALLAATR